MGRSAIHPGEHLAEQLEELDMSAAALARQLKVPTNRITEILNGQRAVTGDTALRLGHFFGTSPEFWMNLQKLYELRLAEQKSGETIKDLPTLAKHMKKQGGESAAPTVSLRSAGCEPMRGERSHCLNAYFDQWSKDVNRAEVLLRSEEYFFEGLLVLSCYIGAIARLRYPQIIDDRESYKKIVSRYSGLNDTFENIDLLFFYQWNNSIVTNRASDKKWYERLKNYPELLALFKSELGDEEIIKVSTDRYQKRERLVELIKTKNVAWFDEVNFTKYIEFFSNNQILYKIVRCEAVHNADLPALFNRSYQPQSNKQTYKDNHQVNREVILNTVRNIVSRLRQESLNELKWPWELK
jgi:addiction module HigA family antidote